MNYLLRTNRKRQWSKGAKVGVTALVIFLVLFVWTFFFPSLPKRVLVSIGIPIWKAEDASVGFFSSLGGYFKEKASLYEENIRLRAEIEASEIRVAAHDLVAAENASLKEVLGRVDESDTYFAYVLQTPGFAPFDYLLIDQGSDAGIQVGMTVGISDNSPIGTIVSVDKKTSTAKLYSSPDNEVEAILESDRVPVKVKGAGAGTYELLVPKDAKAKEGDKIFLPGSAHYLLAIIQSIETKDAETFKKLYARTAVPLSDLRYVFVK